MEIINKGDKEHLKLINRAIRENDIEKLSKLMDNKSYHEDYLKNPFISACSNGYLEIVNFLMTSKTFTPNQLSVRGVEASFRNKQENIINYLIFEYKMKKSGSIEELLIEMSDKNYAQHIEHLFEKREMNKNLKNKLVSKDTIMKNPSHTKKI